MKKNLLAAMLHLFRVSLWRPALSVQTLVCVVLFAVAMLIALAWNLRGNDTEQVFMRRVIMPIYVSILLPLFSLCYAADSIAGDREDRNLLYLLATPLPRPLIYLVKYLAALAQTSVWTLGTFTVMCVLVGSEGVHVWKLLILTIALSTVGYVSLFLLLSALLRRATIVAFCYAIFLEIIVGNMPGTMKRVTVSFYTKCSIFDTASAIVSGPKNADLFLPIGGNWALLVLALGSLMLLFVGMVVFQNKQFA